MKVMKQWRKVLVGGLCALSGIHSEAVEAARYHNESRKENIKENLNSLNRNVIEGDYQTVVGFRKLMTSVCAEDWEEACKKIGAFLKKRKDLPGSIRNVAEKALESKSSFCKIAHEFGKMNPFSSEPEGFSSPLQESLPPSNTEKKNELRKAMGSDESKMKGTVKGEEEEEGDAWVWDGYSPDQMAWQIEECIRYYFEGRLKGTETDAYLGSIQVLVKRLVKADYPRNEIKDLLYHLKKREPDFYEQLLRIIED